VTVSSFTEGSAAKTNDTGNTDNNTVAALIERLTNFITTPKNTFPTRHPAIIKKASGSA
jgi:hypothetical protein